MIITSIYLKLIHDQSFEASAQGYHFTFQKALESATDSDMNNSMNLEEAEENSLMDLDEAKNFQMTGDYNDGESDDESVLSYTSQSHPSTPVPSSEPVTPGAVLPISSSSSNIIMAFSSTGDLEKEKPKKKTVTSAISRALKISEEEKKQGKKMQSGLLKYFSKGTEDN